MLSDRLKRRTLLASPLLFLLPGCSTPLPLGVNPQANAACRARLMDSARVHGWDAYQKLSDINVGYDGQWRPLIDRIQPALVDPVYRGAAQDRLLPAQGVVAQAYRGTQDKSKRKQVFWQRGAGQASGVLGDVSVWYDGQPANDAARLTASACDAVTEVDLFEHQRRFGVLWPMRSYEEVVHPLRLPAHDWYVTGLDVNRGYGIDALRGPVFTGAATPAAAAL